MLIGLNLMMKGNLLGMLLCWMSWDGLFMFPIRIPMQRVRLCQDLMHKGAQYMYLIRILLPQKQGCRSLIKRVVQSMLRLMIQINLSTPITHFTPT